MLRLPDMASAIRTLMNFDQKTALFREWSARHVDHRSEPQTLSKWSYHDMPNVISADGRSATYRLGATVHAVVDLMHGITRTVYLAFKCDALFPLSHGSTFLAVDSRLGETRLRKISINFEHSKVTRLQQVILPFNSYDMRIHMVDPIGEYFVIFAKAPFQNGLSVWVYESKDMRTPKIEIDVTCVYLYFPRLVGETLYFMGSHGGPGIKPGCSEIMYALNLNTGALKNVMLPNELRFDLLTHRTMSDNFYSKAGHHKFFGCWAGDRLLLSGKFMCSRIHVFDPTAEIGDKKRFRTVNWQTMPHEVTLSGANSEGGFTILTSEEGECVARNVAASRPPSLLTIAHTRALKYHTETGARFNMPVYDPLPPLFDRNLYRANYADSLPPRPVLSQMAAEVQKEVDKARKC